MDECPIDYEMQGHNYVVKVDAWEAIDEAITAEEEEGASLEEIIPITTFGPGYKLLKTAGYSEGNYFGTVSDTYFLLLFFKPSPPEEPQ